MQDSVLPRGVGLRKPHISPYLTPSLFTNLLPLFTCSAFSVWSVFSVDSSHAGSAARSAFLSIWCILWFPLHMQSPSAVFFEICLQKNGSLMGAVFVVMGEWRLIGRGSIRP